MSVAPLAGARIEIVVIGNFYFNTKVAPLAGARIEIPPYGVFLYPTIRRSPRGSAD